jgi:hypothetical protein
MRLHEHRRSDRSKAGDHGEYVERDLEAMRERGPAERACPNVGVDVAVRERRRDCRRHGEADCAADLLAGVEQAGCDACLVSAHTGQRADRHRHEREREPETAEQ